MHFALAPPPEANQPTSSPNVRHHLLLPSADDLAHTCQKRLVRPGPRRLGGAPPGPPDHAAPPWGDFELLRDKPPGSNRSSADVDFKKATGETRDVSLFTISILDHLTISRIHRTTLFFPHPFIFSNHVSPTHLERKVPPQAPQLQVEECLGLLSLQVR